MRHDYYGYDQDYEEPDAPTQPRCKCGAMLSWQPTEQGEYTHQHPIYHTEYTAIPGTEIEYEDGFKTGPEYDETYVLDGYETEKQYLAFWSCKRCGAKLEADEVYQ
jgi:hypothetical protein